MPYDDFDYCDHKQASLPNRTGRALVAEDDSACNTLLTHLFYQYGFETDALDNEEDVKKHLQEHPFDYDLICLDWHLGAATGDDFIKVVKDAARDMQRPPPRIIVITGDDSLHSRANEFDGFLTKPYSTRDLHAILNRLGFEQGTEKHSKSGMTSTGTFSIDKNLLCKAAINNPNATAIITEDCKVSWANNAFCILVEELPDTLTGTSLLNIVEKHCPNQMESYLFQSILHQSNHSGGDIVVPWRTRHGRLLWIHGEIQPLKGSEKNTNCFIVTLRDISRQRKNEDALRQSYESTEQLLTSLSAILIGINRNGIIDRWNAAAEQFFNISETDAVGIHWKKLSIDWPIEDIETSLQSKTYNQGSTPLEIEQSTANGDKSTVQFSIHPIVPVHADSASIGHLFLGLDITEQTMMRFQLDQAQKLEAIGQLAAGVAHEINTPTQFIGDNLRFIEDAWKDLQESLKKAAIHPDLQDSMNEADWDFLAEEMPSAISQALEGVERVSKIVGAFKNFSHPGNEGFRISNLNHAIESTVVITNNEHKYTADVILELDPDLPSIPCDTAAVNQVLLNLVINASHAIQDSLAEKGETRGRITIRTTTEADSIRIDIIDSGCGIPDEIRNRVFDPFFTTKEVGKGTGQGLAIAHDVIVNKHHGELRFDSVRGHGTTFTIRLPQRQDEARLEVA